MKRHNKWVMGYPSNYIDSGFLLIELNLWVKQQKFDIADFIRFTMNISLN